MSLYSEPLFRPPSEADSLILQITRGCSHNRCLFCSMYKSIPYSEKTIEETRAHTAALKSLNPEPRRIFLADGNALGMEAGKLLEVLSLVKSRFPRAHRISAYASPMDILGKSPEELREIRAAGLGLLYMGVESGSDTVLEGIHKGVGSSDMITAGLRAEEAGFLLSCMIVTGLGGLNLMEEHALESARVISAVDPRYLSFLTLTVPGDSYRRALEKSYGFREMSPGELMSEIRLMVRNLELTRCVFRANHVSNFLPLGGILSRDRPAVLAEIDEFSGDLPGFSS